MGIGCGSNGGYCKPRRLQHTYFPGLGIKNGLCIVSLPCLTDVFVGFLEELEAETTKV